MLKNDSGRKGRAAALRSLRPRQLPRAHKREFRVDIIRFTVIDETGTASFNGPCHAIKMLVAACSQHPKSLRQLLEATRRFDADFVATVLSGLAVFDEHNTPENVERFAEVSAQLQPSALPPFRVLDERTRRLSLAPVGTGLILFNLTSRRIIQVQNSYAEVLRADRGRIRENGRPTRTLYHYRLPDEWRIVP
jgi:hypothetical protein